MNVETALYSCNFENWQNEPKSDFRWNSRDYGTICKKAVGVTRGMRCPSPGHAPLMASALPVGDLSVRMRNDGHEPNGAEKQ